MNIVLFVKTFPKISETFIVNQVKHIKANVICQIEGEFELDDYKDEEIFVIGDLPFLLKFKRKIYSFLNFYFDPISNHQKKLVVDKLTDCKYDVALIQYGSNAVKFWKACKIANVPYVIHFHGYDVSSLMKIRLYKNSLKKSIEKSKAMIVVNSFQKTLLIDEFNVRKENIYVIPCGVNLDFFKRSSGYNEKCVFIMIGRLTPKKAPLLTFKAFEICAEKVDNIELVIIGDGPLKNELQQKIDSSKFSKKINYLGLQNSGEIKRRLNASDVFLQHSVTAENGDQEGWPISIAEACSMGLPIVSTIHSGIKDQVTQGVNGFLVDEYDYKSMGEFMIKLAENKGLREGMGLKSRAWVEKEGDLLKQISKLKKVLTTT